MAISSYLKRCGYQQNELKNVLYLIPKTATKKVHIDGDEAYVEYSGDTSSIIKIKGNNLAFQEDTSFDDRFRFDKTITLTVDGYITFKDFYSKYYAIVEDKSGTFWMVNADFPSYITYTYTLNDGENKTDLVFYAASNIPTIKLANFNPDNAEECETYMPYGIENLKLLEKNKTKLSTYNKTVSTHDDFKYVEAIDGTYELVEEFNGETYSTQLSFSIPLSVYKASWHVKLLEFEKNKYCGYLILKNSDYKAFLGYNTGLFPSYVINGDIVTITLTESSNYGMVFDDDYHIFEPIYRWTRTNDTSCMEVTNTLWRESGTTCAGEHGVDKYVATVLKVSYDSGITYYNTNVVSATTLIQPNSPDCGYAERWVESGYTCVGYDKYSISIKQESYDSGSTWHNTSYSSTTLIERNSEDCGYSPYYENRYFTMIYNPSPTTSDAFRTVNYSTTSTSGTLLSYSVDGGLTWNQPIGIPSQDHRYWKQQFRLDPGIPTLFKGIYTKTSFNHAVGHFDDNTVPGVHHDGVITIEGNIMSLIYGDDFIGKKSISGYSYVFQELFNGFGLLKSAENLKLPATNLSVWCYQGMFAYCVNLEAAPELPALSLKSYCYTGMFAGCTSLTTVPELPATTLNSRCYANMFSGCDSLTTAPELPVTTLASGCYMYMFSGCDSLTTAPELPAATLAGECYAGMFYGCENLTVAPELSATTLAERCYEQMFQGCTSLATAPELPAATVPSYAYESMFQGCTSLTTVPDLSATTLGVNSYSYMFKNCTSLVTAPEILATDYGPYNPDYGVLQGMFEGCTSLTTAPSILPATTLKYKCYLYMFKGCTSLATAPELPATTLVYDCYESMFEGCTSLTTPPVLPATTLAQNCYANMFKGCTSLTTAPELPATTLAVACYNSMFQGCTSLTTSPVLSAPRFVDGCYYGMFQGCTSLNKITCLAGGGVTSETTYTGGWVLNVPNSGTFIKREGTTWGYGTNAIPLYNWTVIDYAE